LSTASGGICAAYCDNTETSHACPSGMTCDMVLIVGTIVQLCVGAASTTDGG